MAGDRQPGGVGNISTDDERDDRRHEPPVDPRRVET